MGDLVKNLILLVVALVLIYLAVNFVVSIAGLLLYAGAIGLIGYAGYRLIKGGSSGDNKRLR
ncbi:MAG: hypothetical protein HKN78_02355 [Sphingomonadaceae bacterium]|nr:hypothetical protein [Sphingomonadaceae bacterium]